MEPVHEARNYFLISLIIYEKGKRGFRNAENVAEVKGN
jgi:hypothetical protein